MTRPRDTSGVEAKPSFVPEDPSRRILLHHAGAIDGYYKVPPPSPPDEHQVVDHELTEPDAEGSDHDCEVDELFTRAHEQRPRFKPTPTESRNSTQHYPEPSQRKAGECFGPIELP